MPAGDQDQKLENHTRSLLQWLAVSSTNAVLRSDESTPNKEAFKYGRTYWILIQLTMLLQEHTFIRFENPRKVVAGGQMASNGSKIVVSPPKETVDPR